MSGPGGVTPFGVYILTYPGDFHLSLPLVRSIGRRNPGVPVMIIPGEGFERASHPFDVRIMATPPGSFWPELAHQDRKFWAFQGPFETFLYLDADTICTGGLDPLIRRVARHNGNFILVQPWIHDWEWCAVMHDPSHPKYASRFEHVGNTVGRGPLAQFDPDHDFFGHYPFNSGVFASRRLAINEQDLASLNCAERAFCRDVLGVKDWDWRCSALFFRDQGRLNYLIGKLRIPIEPLKPDLICRAGASATTVSVAEVEKGACDFHIVHWMGAKSPSPSLFCKGPPFRLYASLWSFVGRRTGRWVAPGYERLPECVGYSLWLHEGGRSYGLSSLRARLLWSLGDLRRVGRLAVRSLKLLVRAVRHRRLAMAGGGPGPAQSPAPPLAPATGLGNRAVDLSRPMPPDSVARCPAGGPRPPAKQPRAGTAGRNSKRRTS